MNSPLISIIMPVFNAEKYLKTCLDSIVNQTYQNWELLAVNDQSTDQSGSILVAYAEQDQRIKALENPRKGIISALQYGYQYSSGQLVSRMDADDKMTANKLQVLSQKLLKKGQGYLAVGAVRYFVNSGAVGNGFLAYEQWLNQLIFEGNCFDDLYKECVIPSPSWLVWRADFEACGGFEAECYPEDYDLCFRFYQQGLEVLPCRQILHHWRDYPERTSRNDSHYADNRFLDLKMDYFLTLNFDDNQKLILWGAGKKGKNIAKKLVEKDIKFTWICNNSNKIGKEIYGQILQATDLVNRLDDNNQIIVSVAQKEAQKEIVAFFESKKWQPMKDYFFFC